MRRTVNVAFGRGSRGACRTNVRQSDSEGPGELELAGVRPTPSRRPCTNSLGLHSPDTADCGRPGGYLVNQAFVSGYDSLVLSGPAVV